MLESTPEGVIDSAAVVAAASVGDVDESTTPVDANHYPPPHNHQRALSHWHKAKVGITAMSGIAHLQHLASLKQPKAAVPPPTESTPSMGDFTGGKLYHSEDAVMVDTTHLTSI